MNGCDFVKWRGKTQRIRGFIIKKRQVRAAILALFGKQAESREHSTQQRSGRKKRKDKQNITDRQRQTDSSKSMTKHGPTCDLIGKGFFWPPSSRLFGFSTESFFFSWIKCQLGQCFSFFFDIFIFCLPFFFWVAPFGFSWMLDKFLLRAIPVDVNSVPSTSPALLSSPCIHLIFLYTKCKSGSSAAVAVMNDFEVAWRAWPVASRLVVQLLHAHRFPCLELVVGDNWG